jgi:hypothetical protein
MQPPPPLPPLLLQDTGNNALHIASQNDDFEFLELVFRRFKPKPELSSVGVGMSCNPHRHNVCQIIDLDVNAQNLQGNTPLHMAVEFNHVKCKQVLLENGKRDSLLNFECL